MRGQWLITQVSRPTCRCKRWGTLAMSPCWSSHKNKHLIKHWWSRATSTHRKNTGMGLWRFGLPVHLCYQLCDLGLSSTSLLPWILLTPLGSASGLVPLPRFLGRASPQILLGMRRRLINYLVIVSATCPLGIDRPRDSHIQMFVPFRLHMATFPRTFPTRESN